MHIQRKSPRFLVFVSFVCLTGFFLLQANFAFAQLGKSTVRGTVFDEAGGVVPGSEITLTDKGTNVVRSTISDDFGNYEIPGLMSGTYLLEVRLSGFRTFVADNLVLESAEVRRVDAKLTVGELTQQVTVNAAAAVITTEGAKISASLDSETYQTAPLVSLAKFDVNMMLITLPGVQPVGEGFNMNIAGLSGGNNITEGMDGAQTDGTVNQIHNMEDVAELQVVTTNNTADVGRSGYFNLVSKRGTNDVHGNAYYYLAHSAFDARPFFASRKPDLEVHWWGGSVGGPIIKDKTHYYVSYNRTDDPSENLITMSVPTERMRTGDFSQIDQQLINPFSGEPFPNNQIPENLVSPLARSFQERFMPRPNQGGPDALTNNLEYEFPYPFDLYRVDYLAVRIDHQISEKNTLFGRWSNRWTPYVLPSSYPGTEWTRKRYAWQMTYSDTHVFSPQLVNEARFGWYLTQVDDGETVDGVTPVQGDQMVQEIGLQGVNPQGISVMGSPRFSWDGYDSWYVQPGGQVEDKNERSYADMLTWTIGRHIWKFGSEIRTFDNTTAVAPIGTYGDFSFDGRFSGFGYADFLLGLPGTAARLDPLFDRTTKSAELGFYVTDSFKVNPRLTLDLGLRWDYFTAGRYEDGLQYNWDPLTGAVIVPENALSAISPLYDPRIQIVTGDPKFTPDKGNLAPRLGFAFRFDEETVLRGGYGVFTEFWGHWPRAQGGGPFQIQETFINEITDGPALFSFPNPFPSAGALIPSQSISGYPKDASNGYIQQFNLSLEREIWDIGVRFSYQGTRARGLNFALSTNKPEPSLIPFTQDRRPYPQFVNTSFYLNEGATNYDALIIRVLRKAGNLTFDNHFTWARNFHNYLNLENPYSWDMWNRDAMVPNLRLVLNLHWKIPIGRGERYLGDLSGPANGILGNWSVAWNSFMATGQWFSPSFSGDDPSNTNTFGGRPDRIADGNLPPDQRTLEQWFDVSAFVPPPSGRFGNAGVNILEGPGRNVHNVSFAKDFYVTEGTRIQFNWAIGNLFNHPNFSNPRANISAASPGVVTDTVGFWNLENADARRMEMRLRVIW